MGTSARKILLHEEVMANMSKKRLGLTPAAVPCAALLPTGLPLVVHAVAAAVAVVAVRAHGRRCIVPDLGESRVQYSTVHMA